MFDRYKWIIACDGSGYLPQTDVDCPGSFGAIAHPFSGSDYLDSVLIKVGGSRINTTCNQMEVAALGHGLAGFIRSLGILGIEPEKVELTIILDSQYVYCAYNPHPTKADQGLWMPKWLESNWITSSKKQVKNQKLWEFLNKQVHLAESLGIKLVWRWVQGHDSSPDVGNRINNKVDALCTTLSTQLRSTRKQELTDEGSPSYLGLPAFLEIKTSGEALPALCLKPIVYKDELFRTSTNKTANEAVFVNYCKY